ncbi:hypothetical protein [Streptomyces sp. TE5632]
MRPSPAVPGPLRPGRGGGDAARLIEVCAGTHGSWGRICVLPDGHETSMEEPHWGRNSEGRPIAWVGSAPDGW